MHSLTEETTQYLILASDGLWDVLSPEESIQIVDQFGWLVLL